jgi:exodeoxyribonuclease VII large subunit
LLARAQVLQARLTRALRRSIEQRMQQADFLGRRLVHPGERIGNQLEHLDHLRSRLGSAWTRGVDGAHLPLARASHRLGAALPDIDRLQAEQTQLRLRLARSAQHALDRQLAFVARLQAHLHHLDPRQVLGRGYAIVSTAQGQIVRYSAQLHADDEVGLEFAYGRAIARVTKTQD